VSVSFYGLTPNNAPIMLHFDDPAHVNMANGNARAFLSFLGLDPGEHLDGRVSMPEARRAVMRARATFGRDVGDFTREGSDRKQPGRCRVIEGGIDADYFSERLAMFERFLNAVAERGATSIWLG
jgi:hypothetical protein